MTEQHLDRELFNGLQEVMGDEYPALLDTFLADSRARLKQLREAPDVRQLGGIAHSFKGSSSSMGAMRLAELCNQLELRAGQSALDGVGRLLDEIDKEFVIVQALYRAERQRFPG